MTKQTEDTRPDGSEFSAELGPLPEPDMSHRKALDDCDEETSYSAEAMESERQRCYALGMAAERERCAKLCESLHPDANPNDCAWTIRTEWAADSDGPNAGTKRNPTAPQAE
jgi:hypothetical protein